ncbi:MAG: deaminase [Mycobacteriaceae bacterium]|nr:deaminase [Mycobacteriaceae bacterium]
MGKIVISTNVTLDGVVQDPDGKEDFDRGGWFTEFGNKDIPAWAELETQEALEAEALLLGRRSDEWFASRWMSREGVWADRLNSMPKYIVSGTLEQPRWNRNATVLRGDVVKEISELKQKVTGEILVYASYQLGRALIEHDLADELRLTTYPVVLGGGARLFGDFPSRKPARLIDVRALGEGLVFYAYAFVR